MVLNGSWTVSNYLGGHRISKILWFSPNILTTAWSVTDEPFLSFCVHMEVKMDIFVQKHMYVFHIKYDTGRTLCEYKYYVHILQT
jgi:hypothetical protein